MSTRSCEACGTANQPQAVFCMTCGSPLDATVSTSSTSVTGLLTTGQLLDGRYRILTQVGRGGFAAVYKAEDMQLRRQVAVKEMSQSGLSPKERGQAIEDFKREARLLANLMHPHLPHIYDHFMEGGHWYLIMDFIEGETLEDYVLRQPGQRLSLKDTLAIGLELCSVLDYLHHCQPPIIFRDLKPANIMCTPAKQLYLIDFGIARHFKPGQIKDTVPFGSPGYAAPEQYGKSQTTPRSDIYSLGVLLHYLLSGEDPSEKPFFLSPLHLYGSPELAELEDLIRHMIQLDPEKRPASIAEVQARLQAITTSRPEKRIFTLPEAKTAFPEQASERSHPGQEQVLQPPEPPAAGQERRVQPPENPSRRKMLIGGLITGAALTTGIATFFVLHSADHSVTTVPVLSPQTPAAQPTSVAPASPFADVMFGFDAQHTGFNPHEHMLNATNVSRLADLWTLQQLDTDFLFSPIVSGNTVYFGSYKGRVYAYDAGSGNARWVSEEYKTTSSDSRSTPAVVNGLVYTCLREVGVYAFDANTGQRRWFSPTTDALGSSPIVAHGLVYVAGYTHVYAFDAATGNLRWTSSPTGTSFSTSPAVANGIVYVCTSGNGAGTGQIAAFDAMSGQLRWLSQPISGGVDANGSPTVAYGLVYIGAPGGLAAFDAQKGYLRWRASPFKNFTTGSTAVVANDLVYLSIDPVYAFDAMTGKIRWISNTSGSYNGNTPQIANGVLYVSGVSTSQTWIYAIDATTGRLLWTSPVMSGQSFNTPAVSNGKLYYVHAEYVNHQMYAFHLPD